MSLDMTVGTRQATLDAAAERIEAEAGPVAGLRLQNLFVPAAAAFGALLSSALGVLLFLR